MQMRAPVRPALTCDLRAAGLARGNRVLAAGLLLLTSTGAARGDLLPNELPGDCGLTVTVRGAAGPYYRPGLPVVLTIAIENSGRPCEAHVGVSEERDRGTAFFGGTDVCTLAPGSNTLDILAAPAGPAARAKLGIARCRTEGLTRSGRQVYRGDLHRVLRPLGPDERLLLAAGVEAFPLPDGYVHCVLDPRALPSTPYAYAAVDLVVLEHVRRDDVNSRQARALVSWLRSGGRVVFASWRAMGPFEHDLFGDGRPPRTPADLRELAPGSQEHRAEDLAPEVSFPVGLGTVSVFAAEPGDSSKWAGERALARSLTAPAEAPYDVWIDARASRDLAPDRPFGSAADRARTVALVGALLTSVVVALFATRKRFVATMVMIGIVLVWAASAALAFREPEGAIRLVRVRALTVDGRSEIVTDTAAFTGFRKDSMLGFSTRTGPLLPVAHRQGERLALPFWLGRTPNAWRLWWLPVGRDMLALARARSARAADAESNSLRTRALARGKRVGVEALPGGEVRLEFEGEEPASDIRCLLETLGPPVVHSRGEFAWLWIGGQPEGVRYVPEAGFDPAPGSGTLVIAAAPAE